ncbi:proteasome activator complex subunit 3-like [Dysidea avara]|uniref:proteasome activator complex subunit 3-like n=1 Tax=Dysidea avara TaxID=196820 RepID=UPI003333C5F6
MTELKRTNSFDDNPQVKEFREKLYDNVEKEMYEFFPTCVLEMDKLIKSGLFDQSPSSIYCTLPSGVENGPHSENNEDHLPSKKRKLDDISVSLCPTGTTNTVNYPCNKKLKEVIAVLKPHIITLIEKCAELKLWIELKIPKIEDGNNFGVSIQEDILSEVTKLEGDTGSYLEQITRYYTTRGKMMSKLVKYPQLEDYRKAIEEYDEKIYFSLKLITMELRNTYCILHDLITKNIEKLKRPRSSNTDSMY